MTKGKLILIALLFIASSFMNVTIFTGLFHMDKEIPGFAEKFYITAFFQTALIPLFAALFISFFFFKKYRRRAFNNIYWITLLKFFLISCVDLLYKQMPSFFGFIFFLTIAYFVKNTCLDDEINK